MTNIGNQIQVIKNDFPDDGKYRSKYASYITIAYTKSGSINKILLVYTDGALIILK